MNEQDDLLNELFNYFKLSVLYFRGICNGIDSSGALDLMDRRLYFTCYLNLLNVN